MSLSHDFSNYYYGCYIGYYHEGELVPFFVSRVHGGRGNNVESLKVDGYYLTQAGRQYRDNAPLTKENFNLELPEVGYIKVGGFVHWLRYRPQRTMSKGLCSRRLLGADLTDKLAIAIYERSKLNPTAIQFITNNDQVLYKGRTIGEVVGNKWILHKFYYYLSPVIKKVFPEIEVEVKG